MRRSLRNRLAPVALVLLAVCAAACRHASEQALLSQFFSASRLRDRTALQPIATVFFDPADQGIVTRFDILSVSPEERGGAFTTKSVTVEAPIRLGTAPPVTKKVFVTMQRRAEAAWMITGVTVAGPAPPRRGF